MLARAGTNYRTANTYDTANFNDYGRPYLVTETGQLTRATQRTFTYAFSPTVTSAIASCPRR